MVEVVSSEAVTTLHRNPFFLLGASVRDNRQGLIDHADAMSLALDSDVCTKARNDLTNPRNRLVCEIGWMPGLSPKRTQSLLGSLLTKRTQLKDETTLPYLAKANLMMAAIELLESDRATDEWCDWFIIFINTVEKVTPEDILRDINEDRSISGFVEIKSVDQIESAFAEHRRNYVEAARSALDRLPSMKLVDVMTKVMDVVTKSGEEQAPLLSDDLVDRYETEAMRYLQPEADNIVELADAIAEAAPSGAQAIGKLIDRLEQMVRRWDGVAQPIQLSMKARGLQHGLSHKVAFKIRDLGVALFNKHDMLDYSARFVQLLKELFSEVPEVLDTVEKDAIAIEGIRQTRQDAKQEKVEWARDITFEAELGTVFKDKLTISPDGITWKDRHYSLDKITWVRWGGVNKSGSVQYTIAFGDGSSSESIETNKSAIYSKFIECLWRAVGTRMLTEMLKDLQAGKVLNFGGVRIDDYGAHLTKHKFNGDEIVYCSWDKMTYGSSDGSLLITSEDDKKVYASISYLATKNAHILEAMIRLSFKNWKGRLSDLLGD